MVKIRALKNKDGSLNQYIITLPLVLARALDWVEGDNLSFSVMSDKRVLVVKDK